MICRPGDCYLLPRDAAISYDCFHVVKLAMEAMDYVRKQEIREQMPALVQHRSANGLVVSNRDSESDDPQTLPLAQEASRPRS